MKTLILNHNGHQAHVPYELPDSLRFDCFVPGYRVYVAAVDLRADAIHVIEIADRAGTGWLDLDELEENERAAVLEQAGDVCAVFEHALGLSTTAHFHRREEDARVLSTIAEMALLESDLHTAWSRLPVAVTELTHEPVLDPRHWHATKMLSRFVTNVLAPRAQDLATAAAKRRLQDWVAEEEQRAHESARSERTDFRIQFAKERA